MVSRKYLKDYQLEDSLDARGRHRTIAVYIGGDYAFASEEKPSAAQKRVPLYLNLASWVCFVGAMMGNGLFMHTVYCVVPLIACLITIALETEAAIILARAKEPFRRYDADMIGRRLLITALLTLILSGISVLGSAVAAILRPRMLFGGDILFALGAAAITAASALIVYKSKQFHTVKTEKPAEQTAAETAGITGA